MVTKEYMVGAALRAWRRKHTLPAWAMLKALGVPAEYPAGKLWAAVPAERYGELAKCRANRESPLDGRRL